MKEAGARMMITNLLALVCLGVVLKVLATQEPVAIHISSNGVLTKTGAHSAAIFGDRHFARILYLNP